MKLLTPLLMLLAASTSGAARAQPVPNASDARVLKTIQPEDITGLTDVREAEISPDGRHILYVTQPTISQRASRSAIWIVATDGSAPARRLTFSAGLDDAPQWAPDGKSIAFLSNRPNPDATEPSRQLWLISAAGGEAQPLASVGRDIRSFRWSPDGRSIALLAPDLLTARAKSDRTAKRDWVEVDAPKDLNRIWLLDLASRAVRRIAIADRDVTDLSWSPDGKRLALRTAATTGLNDFFYRSDLLVVDATTGVVERTVFKGVYSTASWSPDSRRIAFIAPEDDTIGIRGFVADVSSGALTQLGATLDGTLKRFEWTGNGTLLARAIIHTRSVLSKVDVASGRFQPLITFDGQIKDFSVADGGTIALAGTQAAHAADVWVFKGGKLRLVSNVNPQMRGWKLGKVEEVQWKSSRDGKPVYGVLVTPAHLRADVPTKTIVQPHGGPEGVWSPGWQGSWTEWAQILASRGYVVLLPNPRGSDGQGTDFARGVKNGWGVNDYQDIVDGVDMLVARKIADPARLGIGGWSYGGFMSAWAITRDTRFKTAIVGAGVTDMLNLSLATDTPDWFAGYFGGPPSSFDRIYALSPLKTVDRASGPVLVLHGQEDRRVPLTQGIAFYRGLRMAGKPAELVTYPREPHWILEPEHQVDVQRRVLAWFDAHL